jgi:hypothetical protein
MDTKDAAQLFVSAIAPFVAAGAALWIASVQRKERLSCFISYGGQFADTSFVGVHNRSAQTVAIIGVRYLSGGSWRVPREGTALDYDDPSDIRFPYMIAPGEVLTLPLDEHQAKKCAEAVVGWSLLAARLLRRSRLLVECQSSAGTRYRTGGERVLPWSDRVPWRR